MYEHTDKVLQALNRRFLSLFKAIKGFDELNIIPTVREVYRRAVELAKAGFLDMAIYAYHAAAPGLENPIDKEWLDDWLLLTDPVLQYQFQPEAERKAGRLGERLTVSRKPRQDVNKGLRDLVFQTGQFAVSVTDAATLQGWMDDGVQRVKWVTMEDEKVCEICGPRDGKEYDIDKVPRKPHVNCRCELQPLI